MKLRRQFSKENGMVGIVIPKDNKIVNQYIKDIEKKYNELIMAVGNKYENETRHETALRYIKNYENKINCGRVGVA